MTNSADEARAYDWLGRAKEARAKAEQMTEPDVKQIMLAIAASYEKIAKASPPSEHVEGRKLPS